jgi:toxin FitB
MSGCAANLPLRFEGRIGGVDGVIADEWGRLVARREARGRHIHAMDALIAATALVHGLKLRLNPWK